MSVSEASGFYSGTSNIVVPIRQADYPPGYQGASRLTYYASQFNSLEVNATFYKLPRPATIGSWAESVPEVFRFSFKVPKCITHEKGFQFDVKEVARFADTIAPVASKKRGALLVQLPPSVTRDKQEELEGLLECLADDAPGWPIAVEFRHRSWYEQAIYRVLQHKNVALVQQDIAVSATPPSAPVTPFVYLRYHGPDGGYRGSYSDEFLQNEATRIRRWRNDGLAVYAYFNNTLGAALQNLQTLNRMLRD
ncbi:MAG: DUF72 domain-containing protein [Chitinophagaceae bacterium]|nr:MAG: DUF72 domain-containing protein [Chitinophagaceae bacterium]